MFKRLLWRIWWPFPKTAVSQRFVPFGGILTITFAVNIHLAESNCFQMEISDNMRVYSEKSHWIYYHICFKHDQLQSDLSLFVQWRTRDYIELLLVSIQTEQTLCQTVYSTCYLWGSVILQINARALRRFVPLAWSSALASHFSIRESLYSSTLHEAHFWPKCKQRRDVFCMREDCHERKHREDSTSSVDWDVHWHTSSLRLGVGEGRIRAWAQMSRERCKWGLTSTAERI